MICTCKYRDAAVDSAHEGVAHPMIFVNCKIGSTLVIAKMHMDLLGTLLQLLQIGAGKKMSPAIVIEGKVLMDEG